MDTEKICVITRLNYVLNEKKIIILDTTTHTTERLYVSLKKKKKIYVDLVQLQYFISTPISKLEIMIYVIRNYKMHETFPNILNSRICLWIRKCPQQDHIPLSCPRLGKNALSRNMPCSGVRKTTLSRNLPCMA